jgi:hypothetical protein
VLCVGVGTRLANRRFLMSDFAAGTMFIYQLAGNERLQNFYAFGKERLWGYVSRNGW